MSTLTISPVPAISQDSDRVRFVDVLRSEWTKLRSVPSTIWTILATLVIGIGVSALISALSAHDWANHADNHEGWDPTAMSTAGGALAQLAIAVLGTLVITNEYANRTIRVSLGAVPHRSRLLGAKAVVVGAVALLVGELMAFASFFIGQALISGQHAPTASFSQPGVLRAVLGVGLYIAAIAVLGMGLGALLRSTAGAITSLVALLYVLPGLTAALPQGVRDPLQKYWPTLAGTSITNVVQDAKALGPWPGFAVFCLFVALVLAVANLRLTRKDA
ncbi:MAG TPA: ABC transporter permease [Sporichthyaceae bacterium]|nr:ABC transporter permease [Sporichthyaceae bacterium]